MEGVTVVKDLVLSNVTELAVHLSLSFRKALCSVVLQPADHVYDLYYVENDNTQKTRSVVKRLA